MLLRGTVCDTPGVTRTDGTGRAGAWVEGPVARGAAGTKASTSRRTTRPPGPEPGICSMGSCFSAATFLARGDALTRPLSWAEAGLGAEAAGATDAATGRAFRAGTGAAAGAYGTPEAVPGGGATGAGGRAAPPPRSFSAWASNAEMSSVFEPMTAIRPATGAFWPAFTKIRRRTPAASASISMFALSVSTSARTSPTLMVSPSFLLHLTIRPSSMVGESFERTTFVAIWSSSPLP